MPSLGVGWPPQVSAPPQVVDSLWLTGVTQWWVLVAAVTLDVQSDVGRTGHLCSFNHFD